MASTVCPYLLDTRVNLPHVMRRKRRLDHRRFRFLLVLQRYLRNACRFKDFALRFVDLMSAYEVVKLPVSG